MKDEKIIREEAKYFTKRSISISNYMEPIKEFVKIKGRVHDFYLPNSKAIFLDEIQNFVKEELLQHRIESHDGNADPKCHWENTVESLLFYIRQEIDTLPIVANVNKEGDSENKREQVFVSYSHNDKKFLKDIKRHFKPFLDKIKFWDDSEISPGADWKLEIKKAISTTKVAILLVTTDFLGSEFIGTDEIPPLLEAAKNDGASILILILKPCLFEGFPHLNKYQTMNPPNKPVSRMDENEKEELYVNLVRQTKRILEL